MISQNSRAILLAGKPEAHESFQGAVQLYCYMAPTTPYCLSNETESKILEARQQKKHKGPYFVGKTRNHGQGAKNRLEAELDTQFLFGCSFKVVNKCLLQLPK